MIGTLAAGDVVPKVRPDLQLGGPPPGRGESDIHFTHPGSGKMLVLKAVEVSVARMLDGRRSAEQLIAAAGKIGIPIKLPGLNAFIHKLENEGLLADASMSEGPLTTWAPREEWGPEVRELFQAALRAARVEDLPAARTLLDDLLGRAPNALEAQRLREWVMQRLFPDVLADGPTPSFQQFFAGLEQSWFAEGERRSVEAELDYDISDSLGFPVPGGAGPGKKIALAAGVVLLLAAALVPLPHTATASYQLLPRTVTPVTLDREGKLSAVQVAAGQWVTKGTVLATWDTAEAKQLQAALEARLAAAQAPKKITAAQRRKLPRAKAKLAKAKFVAAFVQKKVAALEKKLRGKSTPALAKLKRSLAAAQASEAAAQREVDALSGQPSLSPAELAALNAQLAQARAAASAPPLTAPADGVVLELAAKPGQPVKSGAPFARLEDSHALRVLIDLPKDEELPPGAQVQLGAPAGLAVTVAKVDGSTAEAEVDNASGKLKPGTKGTASFAGKSRSLLGRL